MRVLVSRLCRQVIPRTSVMVVMMVMVVVVVAMRVSGCLAVLPPSSSVGILPLREVLLAVRGGQGAVGIAIVLRLALRPTPCCAIPITDN